MEFLKQLGANQDEIAKLTSGTDEEKIGIMDAIKKRITDNVANDPVRFKEITDKAKFEAFKIAEKKVAKVFGVTIEEGDNYESLLQKGKELSSANSSDILKKLQDENITFKNELTKYKDEIMPAEIEKERSKVHKVFINNDFMKSIANPKLEKATISKEHALDLTPILLEKDGLVIKFDSSVNKTRIETKDGLKPQIGDVTYDYYDLDAIVLAKLDSYIPKSNGGAQGGGGNPAPQGQAPVPSEISDLARKKLEEINSFANK